MTAKISLLESDQPAVEAERLGRTYLSFLQILFVFSLIAVFNIGSLYGQTSRIVARMTDFRSDNGKVRVTLWNKKEGFPTDASKVFRVVEVPVKNRSSVAVFDSLAPGTYAIAYIHDENNNNRFDFNRFFMPIEGTGASNDARGTIGPPPYKAAAFELMTGEKILVMKTSY